MIQRAQLTFCCSMLCMSGVCVPHISSRFARVESVCIHSFNPRQRVKTRQTTTKPMWNFNQLRDVGSANAGSEMKNAATTSTPFAMTAAMKINITGSVSTESSGAYLQGGISVAGEFALRIPSLVVKSSGSAKQHRHQ